MYFVDLSSIAVQHKCLYYGGTMHIRENPSQVFIALTSVYGVNVIKDTIKAPVIAKLPTIPRKQISRLGPRVVVYLRCT